MYHNPKKPGSSFKTKKEANATDAPKATITTEKVKVPKKGPKPATAVKTGTKKES